MYLSSGHTNISSSTVARNLYSSYTGYVNSSGKLASGLRINKAADDAAGMAISSKLNVQVRSWNKVIQGINQGIDVLKTADDALSKQQEIVTRIKSLVLQGNSDILSSTDKDLIISEIEELSNGIDDIEDLATYNGYSLLQSVKKDAAITGYNLVNAPANILNDINATNLDFSGENNAIRVYEEDASGNPTTTKQSHTLEVFDYKSYIVSDDTSGVTGEVESMYNVKWMNNDTMYFTMDDNGDGNNELYKINKNGSGFQAVDTTGITAADINYIDIANDGTIAAIAGNKVFTNKTGVFTETAIADVHYPNGISWSPDSSKLAYKSNSGNFIKTFDVNADAVIATSADLGNVNTPFWSSDGNIYYSNAGNLKRLDETTLAVDAGFTETLGSYWPNGDANNIYSSTFTNQIFAYNFAADSLSVLGSGSNPDLTPDSSLLAVIGEYFVETPISTIDVSNGNVTVVAENSLKNSNFYTSSQAAVMSLGSDTYTFTYTEATNDWAVTASDGTNYGTISAGIETELLKNGTDATGFKMTIIDTPRFRDNDQFTITTGATAKVALYNTGSQDLSNYTIWDQKDPITTVVNDEGGFCDITFSSTGPVNGTTVFTLNGTEAEKWDDLEINTTLSITSKFNLNLPETFNSTSLNLKNISITSEYYTNESIKMCDYAMNKLIEKRGEIGAKINRLEASLNEAISTQYGSQRSLSSIQDLDYAQEMTTNTSKKILNSSNINLLYQSTDSNLKGLFESSNGFKDFVLI